MSATFGEAQLRRHDDELGTWVEVVAADDTIGMSLKLLADAQFLPVQEDGTVLLAGDPAYRYRPARLECMFGAVGFPPDVLVLERVQ